ncbi:MAG: 50S ribosomal protein L6 [Alphaproteobacteria bacterium]|nr:50S ribosomal protein L6 [Alphaproteobacteria bacterium]
MSRIGKNAIAVPEGVDVTVGDSSIEVSGTKGSLTQSFLPEVSISLEGSVLVVTPNSSSRQATALWGTTRSNIQSMVTGVTSGFRRTLQLQGVGYRAQMQGEMLRLQVGYSHDIEIPVPDGLAIECPNQQEIVISGIDKQRVGQLASEIRRLRPPEPYKGKGIRYRGEVVLRKEGKKK